MERPPLTNVSEEDKQMLKFVSESVHV